jgi:alkaline phosphatase D
MDRRQFNSLLGSSFLGTSSFTGSFESALSAGGSQLALTTDGSASPNNLAGSQPTFLPASHFGLGVASGSLTRTGFVLWTRLLTQPDGSPLPELAQEVRWELAQDAGFKNVIRQGRVQALPDEAHSLRVEVNDLPEESSLSGAPARFFWYRFHFAGVTSSVGRCRTLPAQDSQQALRLALASCQHYEHGFFGAYQSMVNEELDLVLFVGDYIYEYGISPGRTRKHDGPVCRTLNDYRARYALYKSDRDLQAAHAAFPWMVTWDDHEVVNDYANDRSADDRGESFLKRRAAAYRAYWEHQPLRRSQKPIEASLQLYRGYQWGQVANLYLLDARQYRDYHVCTPNDQGGSRTLSDGVCPQRRSFQGSLLGAIQEEWLNRAMSRQLTGFNLIGQASIMAPMRMPNSRTDPNAGVDSYWNDSWDGYPVARAKALDLWGQMGNVVSLGGDVHATYVSDLRANFDDPQSKILASEFVGTSITSPSWPQAAADRIKGYNPHMLFAKSDLRGYTVIEVIAKELSASSRVIDNARIQNPSMSTAARFKVISGKPGAERIA